MPQRIAYITSPGPDTAVQQLRESAAPGFEVEHLTTSAWLFPADPVDNLVAELAYVEAVMRAQRDGFDGAVLGAVADYGLAVARAAVDIPVVGCGQASIMTAAGLGERFGIVTIWPETQAFVYDQLLRDSGALGEQCVAVRHVSTAAEQATLADEDNFYTQMRAGREHMIERIVAEIEAVAQLGADSVVLGCNCMTPVAHLLRERASVPVVDPTAAGYRSLETMLALGLTTAKDPRLPAVSSRQPLLAQLLETVQSAVGEPEDCAVCVLDDDGNASCDLPEPTEDLAI